MGSSIAKVAEFTVGKVGLSESEAQACGLEVLSILFSGMNVPHYYPGHGELVIKLVIDKNSEKILGAQAIGEDGTDKRLDVLAAAVYGGFQWEDLVNLDVTYSPPFSQAKDPICMCGMIAGNVLQGFHYAIMPVELHDKIEGKEDFHLIDVRTAGEVQKGVIPGAVHIELEELRDSLDKLNPQKEIIVYCRRGLRGYLATRILHNRGFIRAQNLLGGIKAWTFGLTK